VRAHTSGAWHAGHTGTAGPPLALAIHLLRCPQDGTLVFLFDGPESIHRQQAFVASVHGHERRRGHLATEHFRDAREIRLKLWSSAAAAP
jgi:hypothetical protein